MKPSAATKNAMDFCQAYQQSLEETHRWADALKEAGLLDAIEQQGFMRKNGAVFLRGDETCNFDFSNQFTDGFKYTYQVPRGDFDKAGVAMSDHQLHRQMAELMETAIAQVRGEKK